MVTRQALMGDVGTRLVWQTAGQHRYASYLRSKGINIGDDSMAPAIAAAADDGDGGDDEDAAANVAAMHTNHTSLGAVGCYR